MLELKNVSKTFNPGTVNEKKALDKLSLNLNEGDFVTIIGANGAGKSTLFNAICGTFYTDEGQIILDGEDITLQPDYIRAKKIGHLFQDPMSGTAPGMTIEENMALAGSKGGWLSHVSKKEKELFREKLRPLNMGLEDRMHQPVDPGTAEKVLNLTKSIIAEHHLTCMMITHNMQSALELGNRTFMMNSGHIIFDTANEERSKLTVNDLLERFKEGVGKQLDNDRMLLS